jgi:transcriptional regulator with XRE-family HTH domain
MKLREYLRLQNKSPEVFGSEIGFSKSAVSMWMRGERMPRREALQKISEHTKGAVTANDFAEAA